MRFLAHSFVVASGCMALLNSGLAAPTTPMIIKKQSISANLEGDGKLERVEVDTTRKKQLSIYRGKQLLWSGVERRVQPWRLYAADVDGDGKDEIIMGTIKSTRFFPRPHHTLSIYGWNGHTAYGKWFGSSLSRTFTDFVLTNMDSDRAIELVALETKLDGRRCLGVFSWSGFGFNQDREIGDWKQAELIGVRNGDVYFTADGKTQTLAGSKIRQSLAKETHER